MSIRKIKDGISSDLKRKARALNSGGRKRALSAMGQAIKAVAVQAFSQPGVRAATWAARKDNKPHALLQKSTTLRKSIRVISATADVVTIGSDRPYAAVHQLGSKKNHIPARPYLPFYKSGALTKVGSGRAESALRSALRAAGL